MFGSGRWKCELGLIGLERCRRESDVPGLESWQCENGHIGTKMSSEREEKRMLEA